MKKYIFILLITILSVFVLTGCSEEVNEDDTITLRVSNWEEYIDLGEWEEDEAIILDDGTEIFGQNSMVDDFEEWFYETYGKKVNVEYCTFGTNEDLYNQITLGDEFDLVCPSEYMIMKLMTEGYLEPFSDDFYDANDTNNYYVRNVSPFIMDKFNNLIIDNEPISKYAAGYMWGTLGIVYNPEYVEQKDAEHFNILLDKDYNKQVTVKDSVRDTYFAGVALNYYDEITSDEFLNKDDYYEQLCNRLNATDEETVNNVEKILSEIQKNVYSFETDSGKNDLVTGKVVANLQWSGDGVYTMDQAEEDGVYLCYANPSEATNLWFDGWCMLKNCINEDPEKKLAAQAFINYVSMAENAVRNMYYIGYSSVISGGDSDIIYDYIRYNYEDDECEDSVDYDISYFFGRDMKFTASEESTRRQLGAQYPLKEVTDKSVVMRYFNPDANERINRMWINVRCFDLSSIWG